MSIIIAQVTKVSSDIPDGKIFVEGPGISPDEPVYYAGPPSLFSMPGKDDHVLLIPATSTLGTAWYWTCQVGDPSLMGVNRETNPQGFENDTKPPEEIEGLSDAQGAALNVFGQVPPDAYTQEHGTPGVVQVRDKRGNRVRMGSKGKEGEGNHITVQSAAGKKLIIEDNPPGFDTGPTPRAFRSKISGKENIDVPSKNRILLTDRNNNRLQIDELKDSIEVHAKNAATLTTEGGRINIGVKKVKNSRGVIQIDNKTTDGNIEIEASRGLIKGYSMMGFDLFSSFNPATPTGVGIQADTGFFTPGPMPQIGIPSPMPNLFMGFGMTVDPTTNRALTETAISSQKFSPLGIETTCTVGMIDTTCMLGPITHTANTGPYTINSPLINLAGTVAVTGNTSVTGDTDMTGLVSVTGDTDMTGLVSVTGNTDITGTVSITGATTITGPTATAIAAAHALGIPLNIAPGVTYNGAAIVTLG